MDFVVWLTKPKLVRAATQANLAKMQRLLAAGVEVDMCDRYGRTALMESCRCGHKEAVQFLLEQGADPHKRSFSGKNAFRYTLSSEIKEILEAQREPVKNT